MVAPQVDLFDKCYKYTLAREVMEMGIYPYFHRVESPQEPVVIIEGRQMVMAGANNYLGLANHPLVKLASIQAIWKYGVGCVGSRFLNGTIDLHEELERRLAKFMKKEAALVFTTGMQTNLGIISALVEKEDYMVVDKLIHASLVDGCKLSNGKVMRFKHNDMNDLERILKLLHGKGAILIIVDGVYSMEGDLANLPEIVLLKEKYGARLLMDDAHGTGLLGKHGRGTAEYFGVEEKVDLIMGTFSKSFAAIGGFVAASSPIIHYLKHHSRSLIFSASLPPSVTASVLSALSIIERRPSLREKTSQNANYLYKNLKQLGFNVGNPSPSAIIPIVIGDSLSAFKMWRLLFDEGVFTTPVIAPAVPNNRALIRISTMASHRKKHLNKILRAFINAGENFGIIEKRKKIIPLTNGWKENIVKWMSPNIGLKKKSSSI